MLTHKADTGLHVAGFGPARDVGAQLRLPFPTKLIPALVKPHERLAHVVLAWTGIWLPVQLLPDHVPPLALLAHSPWGGPQLQPLHGVSSIANRTRC